MYSTRKKLPQNLKQFKFMTEDFMFCEKKKFVSKFKYWRQLNFFADCFKRYMFTGVFYEFKMMNINLFPSNKDGEKCGRNTKMEKKCKNDFIISNT